MLFFNWVNIIYIENIYIDVCIGREVGYLFFECRLVWKEKENFIDRRGVEIVCSKLDVSCFFVYGVLVWRENKVYEEI